MNRKQKPPADKLETLRRRKAAIDDRMRRLEALLASQNKKSENRLKILVGVAFLSHMAKRPELRQVIETTLNHAIINMNDREFLQSKGWMTGK